MLSDKKTTAVYLSWMRLNKRYDFSRVPIEGFQVCFRDILRHYKQYPTDKYTYLLVRKWLLAMDLAVREAQSSPELTALWKNSLVDVDLHLRAFIQFCLQYALSNPQQGDVLRLREAVGNLLSLTTPRPEVAVRKDEEFLFFRSAEKSGCSLSNEFQALHISS